MIDFFFIAAMICPLGPYGPGMVLLDLYDWPVMYAVPTFCRGEV